MTTENQIFAEIDEIFNGMELTSLEQKIDKGLNIYELDNLIESFSNKYGTDDEVVLFYQKKRGELLNEIIKKLSK
jgi:hypothetical protein|tara:strand:- start:855 stop:1079 length:225 start_codon:yes stop_codon:yes gene_type:complete